MRRTRLVCLAMFLTCVVPQVIAAQSLAYRYWLVPKAEESRAVEEALGDFTGWLRQEGEPWRWSVFRVIAGDELGTWVLRSGGHTWDELDARDAGFGPRAIERFESEVLPLLESATLQIEETNEEMSRRAEEGPRPTLYHITEWKLEPGAVGSFYRAVDSIMESHEQAGIPFYSSYFDVVASNGVTVRRSRNYAGWISFQGAPRFGETLVSTHGSARAEEILESYRKAVKSVRDFVLRGYPELRVPGGG